MKEQRRFPRVTLDTYESRHLELLNARLVWPNLESSTINDLSFKGVAARKPGVLELRSGETMNVELHLGLHTPFQTQAKLVWSNLDQAGLEFTSLPAEGHRAMAEFLGARLIGQQLRLVQTEHRNPGDDYSMWLQGPEQTHVFLWTKDDGKLQRAIVNFDSTAIELEPGLKAEKLSGPARKALLVLAQIDKPELAIKDFILSFGE